MDPMMGDMYGPMPGDYYDPYYDVVDYYDPYMDNNYIAPVPFDVTESGTTGDDTFTGTTGNDAFVFTANTVGGTDTIDGAGGTDRIVLSEFAGQSVIIEFSSSSDFVATTFDTPSLIDFATVATVGSPTSTVTATDIDQVQLHTGVIDPATSNNTLQLNLGANDKALLLMGDDTGNSVEIALPSSSNMNLIGILGAGDDTVNISVGNEVASGTLDMGAGTDTLIWDPTFNVSVNMTVNGGETSVLVGNASDPNSQQGIEASNLEIFTTVKKAYLDGSYLNGVSVNLSSTTQGTMTSGGETLTVNSTAGIKQVTGSANNDTFIDVNGAKLIGGLGADAFTSAAPSTLKYLADTWNNLAIEANGDTVNSGYIGMYNADILSDISHTNDTGWFTDAGQYLHIDSSLVSSMVLPNGAALNGNNTIGKASNFSHNGQVGLLDVADAASSLNTIFAFDTTADGSFGEGDFFIDVADDVTSLTFRFADSNATASFEIT